VSTVDQQQCFKLDIGVQNADSDLRHHRIGFPGRSATSEPNDSKPLRERVGQYWHLGIPYSTSRTIKQNNIHIKTDWYG
jgi:hypothetical protein